MLKVLYDKFIVSRLFTNSIWAISGSFISKGINFFSIVLIARFLGPKIFGEYNVLQLTVGLFGTFSGLGLGLAATKLIAEWREKNIEKVGRIIGTLYILSFFISLTVSVCFFSFSDLVANNLLNNGSLTILFKITAAIVIFDSINGVQNGVLTGFESFKEIAIISVIIGVIGAPLLVLGAYTYGLVGLTIMLLFVRFLNLLINSLYLQKKIKELNVKVKPQIRKNELKRILNISIPSFLSSVTTSPINWISTSVFVNQPNGYSDLGTFNAGNQLKTIVLFLPDSAGKLTIPRLANEFGNNYLNKFRKTVTLTFIWNLILSVLPAVLLYFFRSYFQQFMGVKFDLNNELIVIVLSIGVFTAITNSLGYIFICSNLIWYDFVLRIFWGISLIILIEEYGKFHGAIGYGYSLLGAGLINIIMHIIILVFNYKSFYNDKK